MAQRQLLLGPMAAEQAARLFRALAPRPISRLELGCDDPAALKRELGALFHALGGLEAPQHPHPNPKPNPNPNPNPNL